MDEVLTICTWPSKHDRLVLARALNQDRQQRRPDHSGSVDRRCAQMTDRNIGSPSHHAIERDFSPSLAVRIGISLNLGRVNNISVFRDRPGAGSWRSIDRDAGDVNQPAQSRCARQDVGQSDCRPGVVPIEGIRARRYRRSAMDHRSDGIPRQATQGSEITEVARKVDPLRRVTRVSYDAQPRVSGQAGDVRPDKSRRASHQNGEPLFHRYFLHRVCRRGTPCRKDEPQGSATWRDLAIGRQLPTSRKDKFPFDEPFLRLQNLQITGLWLIREKVH